MPRRDVHQADALVWMKENPATPAMSVITSLPDVTEVAGLDLDAWKKWFIDAARLVLRWVPMEGVAIFYQSDIKHRGEWIDKGYLIQRAIEQEESAALICHKIVCRHPPGTIAIGRPSYSHMICARHRRPGPDGQKLPLKPGPDVLPDAGHAPWSRAMGSIACRVAIELVSNETSSSVIVDPFCGRGTVLAVANTMGFDALGIDISAKRCRAARSLVVGSARLSDESDEDALTRGARLFDEGAFFEAHEAWEERWRVEPNEVERTFLQGLIQLAAAFHKREVMGVPEAAGRLLSRSREKLAQVPARESSPIDLDQLRLDLENVARVIEQADAIIIPPKLLCLDHS